MSSDSWLSKIRSPQDLKGLKIETLEALATEMRQVIAETCSRNGGHFAPSLGVVELTIALHCVYNTPEDRIVWDVGHQCYPHKLLTGRAEQFRTLRLLDGIKGFPRRDESPYDAFGVGHASTAISAALGMALARDRQKKNNQVIAVCGDGAMTGGLCYEALNNLGYLKPDMLVILNDNKMSISPNIGAMSKYLRHLLTLDVYNKSKETAEDMIKRVHSLGKRVVDFSQRLEQSVKSLLLTEGETLFEKMGIRYLGPVNGHDLRDLIYTLTQVRDLKGPILLHVKTTKGKGYPYSESDPEHWHSGASFEVKTGKKIAKPPVYSPGLPVPTEESMAGDPTLVLKPVPSGPPPTYTEVFSKALVELADKDKRIVSITAGMSIGTGLEHFAQQYPERFYDVGIAEAHAVCCAAGMAAEGMRPVVAIYSSFLQRGFDNVLHDVALQKLPVTFALDRAGLVGDDGPTHHGIFDLAYLRMIPDMVVMAPRDENQLCRMMATAATYEDGPISYRYPRGRALGIALDETAEPITIGTAEVLREPEEGARRVALLSIGTMASTAMTVAELLQERGIGTAVIDMRFVKPLDRMALSHAVKNYELLVTLEENCIAGGFGSAVNEALGEIAFPRVALTLGIPDRWIEQGPVPELMRRCELDPESIVEKVYTALKNMEVCCAR
ncbi:TPA: 1-deoxy-D-xylulose-5-phosphate synthase [Candidatus Sumerlaeota bacterium]|nr:1-deoxy-D-xylulose-5-phosphate synthase [Candidatus Sumerlaeota bacterium]